MRLSVSRKRSVLLSCRRLRDFQASLVLRDRCRLLLIVTEQRMITKIAVACIADKLKLNQNYVNWSRLTLGLQRRNPRVQIDFGPNDCYRNSQSNMDLFDDVTQNCNFFVLSIKIKNHLHESIYRTEFRLTACPLAYISL